MKDNTTMSSCYYVHIGHEKWDLLLQVYFLVDDLNLILTIISILTPKHPLLELELACKLLRTLQQIGFWKKLPFRISDVFYISS